MRRAGGEKMLCERVVTILLCLVASLRRGFVDDLSKGGTKITLVIALRAKS